MATSTGVPAYVPNVLVPIAHASEEIEIACIQDVLVRAGCKVTLASAADINEIKCSRGLQIAADVNIRDCVEKEWDAVVLPGGMPGAKHLHDNQSVQHIIKDQHAANKLIGAICAAPAVILAPLGVLKGKTATCYPAEHFNDALKEGGAKSDMKEPLLVVEDGHIVTSKGPGTALVFAVRLAGRLMGEEVEARLAKELLLV